VGEGASPSDIEAIRAAATRGADIEQIIHMKTLYLGPDELLVGMKVAVIATTSAQEVSAAINAVEQRVRAAVPIARVIYIEPDIFDPEYQAESESSGATTAHSGHPVPAAPTPGEPGAVSPGVGDRH